MPMRPCLDITIWEASPWCQLLHPYLSLFRSMWWYAYHTCLCHPLAFYASLHTCLHVYAWVLLASVSSMLQHNEVIDIQSKPTFIPSRTPPFLCFPCLFALFGCWLAFLLLSHVVLAISIFLVCFVTLCFYLRFFLPLLVCWFSCLCLCLYTYEARTYGARAWSPKHKQKGQGHEHLVELSDCSKYV